jgi:hypothetical protein
MRTTIVIAWCEIVHHRFSLVAAAAASLLPLILPLLFRVGHDDRVELRSLMAIAIAFLLSTILSLLLGSSFIARDLAENRFSFYLARPVSGAAIWFGRLTGIYVLAVTGQLIVLGPVVLISPVSLEKIDDPVLLTFFFAGPLAVTLLAHATSIMVRARSPWIAVDLVALAVISAIVWSVMRPLLVFGAPVAALVFAFIVAAMALLALLVAGAVQVTMGRTDLWRCHRALSVTLWSLLLAGSLATVAYGRWLRAAEPTDLTGIGDVLPTPAGDWLAVSGPLGGRFDYQPDFLYNTKDGAFVRLGLRSMVQVSFDGTKALVLLPEGLETEQGRELRLVRYDLEASPPRRQASLLTVAEESIDHWASSPDGGRIGLVQQGLLTVYDLDEERTLISKHLGGEHHYLWFLDRDLARAYLQHDQGLRIFEIDLTARVVTETGGVSSFVSWFRFDASGEQMLAFIPVSSDSSPVFRLSLHSAVTGAVANSVAPQLLQDAIDACFLADGRIVVAASSGNVVSLRILSPNGELHQQLGLQEVNANYRISLRFHGQPTPDMLWVMVLHFPEGPADVDQYERNLFLVSLDSGSAKVLPDFWANTSVGWSGKRPLPPGGLSSRLLVSGSWPYGQVLLLDTECEMLRPLLSGNLRLVTSDHLGRKSY